jgi:hypothetical protein
MSDEKGIEDVSRSSGGSLHLASPVMKACTLSLQSICNALYQLARYHVVYRGQLGLQVVVSEVQVTICVLWANIIQAGRTSTSDISFCQLSDSSNHQAHSFNLQAPTMKDMFDIEPLNVSSAALLCPCLDVINTPIQPLVTIIANPKSFHIPISSNFRSCTISRIRSRTQSRRHEGLVSGLHRRYSHPLEDCHFL